MLDSILRRILESRFVSRTATALPSLMVTVACFLVIGWALIVMVRTTRIPLPSDMWEAATVTVAARLAQGEPMYAAMEEPHGLEPGLYSPLQPVVLGSLFRLTGVGWLPLRLINLFAGAAFILIFLRALKLPREPGVLLFAVAVLLAINQQLQQETGLWALPRTDAVALLFGLIFVVAGYIACAHRSVSWALLAHAALLVGFFWKQTVVAVAMAPFVAALFSKNTSRRFLVLFAVGPPIALVGSAVLIHLISPNMFQAMFETGPQYAVHARVVALYLYGITVFTPLFWLTLLWVIFSPGLPVHDRTRFTWAVSTMGTAIPLNLLAAAKVGGGPNSLAHTFYAAAAALLCCAPGLLAFLRSSTPPAVKRLLLGGVIAGSLVVTAVTVVQTPPRPRIDRPFGDAARPALVRIAKALPGKVVSPQDPTIALEAKGYAGVASVNEWDRRIWSWPLPKTIHEMNSADYVVTWGRTEPQIWTFKEGLEMLPRLGFEPMQLLELEGSGYTVWKRVIPRGEVLPIHPDGAPLSR